jgi:hypothetical protein
MSLRTFGGGRGNIVHFPMSAHLRGDVAGQRAERGPGRRPGDLALLHRLGDRHSCRGGRRHRGSGRMRGEYRLRALRRLMERRYRAARHGVIPRDSRRH